MNKQCEPAAAIISLFRSGEVFILRIADVQYTATAMAIAQTLQNAQSLVVVTPTDTKMFNLSVQKEQQNGGSRSFSSTPQSPASRASDRMAVQSGESSGDEELAQAMVDDITADSGYEDPQEAAARLAQQAPPEVESAQDIEQAINEADTPAARRKALNRQRKAEAQQQSAANSTCGRCRGAGQIPIMLEGGVVTQQACPVCQGKGQIQRFGNARR